MRSNWEGEEQEKSVLLEFNGKRVLVSYRVRAFRWV